MMEFEIKRRGAQAQPSHRQWKRLAAWLGAMLALVGGLGVYRYIAADPTVNATMTYEAPNAEVQAAELQWPAYGQAAIATSEQGVVGTHGEEEPRPTASTAKLITMLALMQKRPFDVATEGPTITLGAHDVELYNYYIANNGSNVAVVAGEQITQYEAMEAVLLASSNNMADSLAIWAFGSLDAYRAYATEMLQSFGLSDTTVGVDASGLSPTTTSTAHDLAVIGLQALKDPVIASIVAESKATIPVAGTITNTNTLLLHDDIIGIKTGETVEAGGVFVLGGVQHEGDASQQIVVTVMGAELGSVARADSYTLFESAKKHFQYTTLAAQGDAVGWYEPSWSAQQYVVVADETVRSFVWRGSDTSARLDAQTLHGESSGDVGTLVLKTGDVEHVIPVRLKAPVPEPTVWWRVVGRGW